MLVPAQWQGSVEHYYHYLLGYFVPLVRWQEASKIRSFAVRDCGPMNPWFELLHPGTNLTYLPPGVMLERYLSHRQERVVLRSWDDPQRFHAKTLLNVRETITRRAGAGAPPSKRNRIVIIDRRPSSDFFQSDQAEVAGSGAQERSIPNMPMIGGALQVIGDVEIIDTAAMTPVEQVQAFAGAQLFVAQHGAGLANMLWLPPEAAVLEIQPPLPQIIDSIFVHLAAALRHDFGVVRQEHAHAPVNPESVLEAAVDLLTSPGQRVPQAPGRWPTRVIRRLPRRL